MRTMPERRDKTVRQDDPTTPYGTMVKEQQEVLAGGKAVDPATGKAHQGLPIVTAMKMVVAIRVSDQSFAGDDAGGRKVRSSAA